MSFRTVLSAFTLLLATWAALPAQAQRGYYYRRPAPRVVVLRPAPRPVVVAPAPVMVLPVRPTYLAPAPVVVVRRRPAVVVRPRPVVYRYY